MAFYISHDTFITGDTRVGINSRSDKNKLRNLSTQEKQIVRGNIATLTSKTAEEKDKEMCKTVENVEIRNSDKSLKQEMGVADGSRHTQDWSQAEGRKPIFHIKIESVQNITLPSPRNARKTVNSSSN